MTLTAPQVAPALTEALAELLAERDKDGNIQRSEEGPVFSDGATAFAAQVAAGVQVILDALMRAQNGNPDEILATATGKLTALAGEHLKTKDQRAAIAAVLAFLRGTFLMLPLTR